MHTKDDPLDSGRPRVTLWLDREHMLEARDNYFRAYLESMGASASSPRVYFNSDQANVTVGVVTKSVDEVRVIWDISYTAAVAAFDFLMAGKVRP